MTVRHFKATVEYDGTSFAGFQWQNNSRTVQGVIESAITKRTGQTIRLTGAGRTDSGVHALGQVVSFGVETAIPLERMALALNSALPEDVSIRKVEEVRADFSARFSASSRVYGYLILNSRTRSALWRRYSALCTEALNKTEMHRAAGMLLGERDFAAFANELQSGEPTMRNVMRCGVWRRSRFVLVRIEANAFLRGMVRTIVGTLIQVGAGARTAESVAEVLETRDRRNAGPSAPAEGLCLIRVIYGARASYERNSASLSQETRVIV
jgi:tRNA pseudouridine38-40 synthase